MGIYRTVIALFLASVLDRTFAFVLDGSSTSYAQFHKWNAGLNGTLEFEFKTDKGNGLLLYTDDGGTYDFFEVKLVESALRLRYNLGGGAQIVTVGHDLGDGHWHKVQIVRHNENTTINVDGVGATSTSRGREFEFGKLNGNSDVYVGGMPSWYNRKLTLLALPSVIFEPRFTGVIRNLVYADRENVLPRRQEIKSRDAKCESPSCEDNMARKVVRSLRNTMANTTDACETHDPCKHKGICISTDTGPICDCRSGDYEGVYCEKGKEPSEASFRGSEYLTIDLIKGYNAPVLSTQESINLQFKTKQPNGLLYYSGHGNDYLTITLRDGGVAVGMALTNGRLDLQIKPTRVRFDDNRWHKLSVHRKVQSISTITSFCRLSATVDGIYAEHGHTAGSFTRLASERILVGGGADAREMMGAKGLNNFIGCLRKIEFMTENVKMELIESAKNGAVGAVGWGKIDYHCRDPRTGDPVTFTTRDSHLVLPSWKAAKSGSISFKIRTNEPNGLVMYSQSGAPSQSDFFAFEMLGGHMYLHMDLGEGPVKVKASKHRIDNGTWHEVSVKRMERDGNVTVDGVNVEFKPPGDRTQLDLDGLLYIGGVGSPYATLSVPAVLWTASLRQGYVGCMRDLVVNSQPVDIAGYAEQQDSGAVRPACHVQPLHCPSHPCMHGGHCLEGWNRFHCDCTGTSFTGAKCGKDASTLFLNGSQQMTALMPEDSKTQAEEVVIRFKTTRPRGLLLATSLENSMNRLQMSLEDGTAKLLLHIEHREKVMKAGQGLNNDAWHTLRFSRRANSLKFQVDDESPIRSEESFDNSILEFRTLHVGGYLRSGEEVPHFIGQIEQVWFNGYPYLEIARSVGADQSFHQGVTPNIRVTGKFRKRNHPVHHPFTFTSKHTFVGLHVLKAYVDTNIYFQFRTREANGLILFNGARREKDFIAVELVNGHVHYVFDLGDGPVKVRDTSKTRLNDGKWHAVSIARPAPKHHTLAVDDHVAAVNSQGSNQNLDLDGILYIGGVEKSQYGQLPKHVNSKHGFEGCLASLDLNGESPDLISDAVVKSNMVESGCDVYANLRPGKKCTHDLCVNHGTCVQQWHSYTCDCDMTSFSGPTCADESISYEFGAGRGLVTYTFPPDRRPDMRRDTVAVGFVTGANDAVLLRIESASSNDYLEIEIVDGNVFAVYNMGTNDHPIGDVGVKVNDNQYHVIRLTRSGANSTLQVDDYNVQSNHPLGPQLVTFNSQSTIQIGGRWNRVKGKIERSFLGIMSGLVVNGAKVFELAASKDPRVAIRGDVQILPIGSLIDRASPLQRMQQTLASRGPGVMDDLIFSGAGSGCAGDDEDEECAPIVESGTDDLVTPVYVASTRSPPRPDLSSKTKSNAHLQVGGSCDDEEDCSMEGSGESPRSSTTEEIFISSSTDSSSVTYTTQLEVVTSHISTTSEPSTTTTTTTTPATTSSSPSSQGFFTTSSQHNVTNEPTETSYGSTEKEQPTVITYNFKPPFEMTEPPPPPPPPAAYPPFPTPHKPTGSNKIPRITSEAAENAALIIGIIASALIAIVLIILLILKFKNRPEANYKIDEAKSFCQDPNAALLGGGGPPGVGQPYNGALKNGANSAKTGKSRQLKDIKEWYV